MRKQACNSKLRHSLTILQQVRTIGAIEGFNDMEKASLLVVCSGENPAVESVLAQSGYRVTSALSGAYAESLLLAQDFDLIVLDLGLPRLLSALSKGIGRIHRGPGYPL